MGSLAFDPNNLPKPTPEEVLQFKIDNKIPIEAKDLMMGAAPVKAGDTVDLNAPVDESKTAGLMKDPGPLTMPKPDAPNVQQLALAVESALDNPTSYSLTTSEKKVRKGGGGGGHYNLKKPELKSAEYDALPRYDVDNDKSLKDYEKQRGDLEHRLANAQADEVEKKKHTQDEKIAMALIGLLPGLLGTGIGAALGGPTVAAAGAAGGLQGGAHGAQMINDSVKERGAEAKSDREKVDHLLEVLAAKADARKASLEDRNFNIDQNNANFDRTQKVSDAKEQNAFARQDYINDKNNAAQDRRQQMQLDSLLERAQISANAKGGHGGPKLSPQQNKLIGELAMGMHAQQQLGDLDKTITGWIKGANGGNPGMTGPMAGRMHRMAQMTNSGDSKWNQFAAGLGKYFSDERHTYAGVSVTPQEMENLRDQIPDVTKDSEQAIHDKLLASIKWRKEREQAMLSQLALDREGNPIDRSVLAQAIGDIAQQQADPVRTHFGKQGKTKPDKIVQDGHTYYLNPQTGEYE